MSVGREFARYVLQSVMGMVGISLYILADTFFISVAGGADGIATLNLALPIYSFIFAIGSMIGVGAATRFAIYSASGNARADRYFTNSILWCLILSFPAMILGGSMPGNVLRLMGGNDVIVRMGTPYLRIVFLFTPGFMLNYVFNAFTRNDGRPTLAMIATLASSMFNILFDYILMFPCGLGMTGAALATAVSPLLGCLICATHLFSKRSTVGLKFRIPSLSMLLQSCSLGISAFVGEFASGITTLVFNTLILKLAGNTGVAAYGVIANIALVVTAVLNGIALGGQPLQSRFYGQGEKAKQRRVLMLSMISAVAAAAVIIACSQIFAGPIVRIFNSENNARLQELAERGIRIYFPGALFAGINMVGTGYFSATDRPFWSSLVSILRGVILIIGCAVVLAALRGMEGVWLSFPVAEALTMVVTFYGLTWVRERRHRDKKPLNEMRDL